MRRCGSAALVLAVLAVLAPARTAYSNGMTPDAFYADFAAWRKSL